MEQAGDAITQIRRVLRERTEQDMARSLDRQRRAATRWTPIRRLLRATPAVIDGSIAPVVAARIGALGPAITGGMYRVVRSSARRAQTLGVLGAVCITRAARWSIASVGTAIADYRARRAEVRLAHRHSAASVPDAAPVSAVEPPPADPRTERERAMEALERQHLSLREESLGPDHPDVAVLTHIIATRCVSRGDYDEARALYERTVRIFERSLGADHPELAEALTDLAELHAATGRMDEAARCATRAADIAARRRTRAMIARESPAEAVHPST